MDKIKCIKFPKIEQFRNVVASLNRQFTFVGIDEHGDPIYNKYSKKEKISFFSTIKLHGSNAGVSYNNKLGIWTQSRNNAFRLDRHDSHMGFTFFVNSHKEFFENIINKLSFIYDINLNENTITIYSEWVGKGIQKGVGVSNIEKSSFIFAHFKVSPFNDEIPSYWIPTIIPE